MSVRAYRVNKVERAEDCSFNCWHDEEIIAFLVENEMWDGRNDDGVGFIEVSVETLEKLVKELKWDAEGDWRRDAIEADIAWARENLRDWIQYDCF